MIWKKLLHSMYVFKREVISVTDAEIRDVEAKYDHKCDLCKRIFKTRRGMLLIHRVPYATE